MIDKVKYVNKDELKRIKALGEFIETHYKSYIEEISRLEKEFETAKKDFFEHREMFPTEYSLNQQQDKIKTIEQQLNNAKQKFAAIQNGSYVDFGSLQSHDPYDEIWHDVKDRTYKANQKYRDEAIKHIEKAIELLTESKDKEIESVDEVTRLVSHAYTKAGLKYSYMPNSDTSLHPLVVPMRAMIKNLNGSTTQQPYVI